MAFFVLALALITPAGFAANPELPNKGLENRIEFWKKIFTQYGQDDIVLHDSFYVDIIYDIASDGDVDRKERVIHTALSEMKTNWAKPSGWSSDADSVFSAIAATGIEITPALIGKLEDNVQRQRGIKERFRDGVVRSGRYIDSFREVFRKAGLPEELALLPMVESSFVNARSRVGAVGIWQFMPGTARLYIKVNNKVDERLDPAKATQAAAKLMASNYSALKTWPLAVTAYNHGQNGMMRAQKAHGDDLSVIIENYESPLFGYASMNFYSEFLAAVEVYESYPQYFGQLVLDKPEVSVPAPAAAPKAVVATASAKSPKPAAAKPAATKYKVRSGDTLWEIAQKFGTSIGTLMERNNLDKPMIYAGQLLLIR
ncbi:MAG TPA: transglycosylase SLT domain-containing protein [Terriglobia bacterium]|nr:transglycosylase SLT domain-containing protein [Terriglobia bacterium]